MEHAFYQILSTPLDFVDYITDEIRDCYLDGTVNKLFPTSFLVALCEDVKFSPEQLEKIAIQKAKMQYAISKPVPEEFKGKNPLYHYLGTKERDFAQL